jgi:hypothetical protein
MLLGKLVIYMQKTETRSTPFTLYKYQSKVDQRLNAKPEILKSGQERVGSILEHIGISYNFLTRIPVAQQLRESPEKWDYMEWKSFFTAKEMIITLRRLPTD